MEEEDLEQQAYIISETEIPPEQPEARGQLPVVTFIIIAANVIAFIMCYGVEDYWVVGGTNYEYITIAGEYGRLLSAMFIHMDLSHLFWNMVALLTFGIVVEGKMGGFRMNLIYFISGLVGNVVSTYTFHATDPDTMHFGAGASGAVYGVMCAYMFLSVKGKRSADKNQMIRAIVLVVLFTLFGYFVGEEYEQNIDLVAHLAGAVTGGVMVFLLSIRRWEFFNENMFFRLLAVILSVSLCAAGIGEAHIGDELAELPSEYVDYIKAQVISEDVTDVTYGDGLAAYCTDERWKYFFSKQGNDIVQFDGNATYKWRSVEVTIQFKVDEDCGSYELWYIGLDDEGLNGEEATDFLLAVIQYLRKVSDFKQSKK